MVDHGALPDPAAIAAAGKEIIRRARGPGRPPKISEDAIASIYSMVAAGNYLETAAAFVGVHRTTLHDWPCCAQSATWGPSQSRWSFLATATRAAWGCGLPPGSRCVGSSRWLHHEYLVVSEHEASHRDHEIIR